MRAYLAKAITTGIMRNFGSAFIAMVLITLIIRKVGTGVYGAWALVLIFVGLSANMDIGIPKALIYIIPKITDRQKRNSIFTSSAVITFFLMLVVVTIGTALIFFQVRLFGSKTEMTVTLSNLLLLSATNIISCGLISSLCQSVLEANYKIHIVNAIFFSRTVCHYSALGFVSFYSIHPAHLIYATNLVFIAFAIIDVFSVKIFTSVKLTYPSFYHIKAILNRGKDFFVIGLATAILQPLTRYLVALFAVDIAANGVYDISLKIAMMASGALTCFSIPLFSLFSGYGENKINKIKRILHKMTSLLVGLFTLGATLYLFTGKELLELIFDTIDSRLFYTSLILLLGRALSSVFEPYVRAMWALGHTKQCIAVKFLGLFVTIFLVFALSFIREPLYRIAFSFVTPMLCGAFFLCFMFHYLYGFHSISLEVSEKITGV